MAGRSVFEKDLLLLFRFAFGFAALGALKDLQPALRTEAEAVAEEARARLMERDPNSRLAQSINIMVLEAGDQPAYAVGTDDQAGFFLEFGTSRMRSAGKA